MRSDGATCGYEERGRVVRAPDLKSLGPGFKARSDHLVLGSGPRQPSFNFSAALVGILNLVMFILFI